MLKFDKSHVSPKEDKLVIYIDENDLDYKEIEVIRLGTDEHKVFIPQKEQK